MKKFFYLLAILVLLTGLMSACSPKDQVAPEDAALKITGAVANEKFWSEEQVKAMDTSEAERANKEGEMETYTGVSIKSLLDMAGVNADASTIVFVADDGYEAELALADVLADAHGIISFRSNGGFSVVLPDLANNAQVKGVVEIKLK